MVWHVFSDRMQKALERKGFSSPTNIQEAGIPVVMKGGHSLLLAPTGLGKTESVLLPIFDSLIRGEHPPISVLYITPLKSLNRDLLKRMLWWANELDFEVSVRHGDTSKYERYQQVQNPADLFIITPETLQSMLVGKKLREHLSNVRWVVIDEIHELVGNKRGVQLSVGLERLKELIAKAGRKQPQLIALSATVGSPETVAGFMEGVDVGKIEIVNTVNLRRINLKVERPVQKKKQSEDSEKLMTGPELSSTLRAIADYIRKKNSILIFTNTRESAEVLSSRLKVMDGDLGVETHHSSLSKNVRIEAEERFKKGEIKSLVCTSSLELGIDIGAIDFILQYMSPRQVSKILQRVGRSNHTSSGVSDGVIIASGADDCFESAAIAKLVHEGFIESTNVYGKSLDVLGHQIVGLALEEYSIPLDRAYQIIKRAFPFRKLTPEEFTEAVLFLQRLGLVWADSKFSKEPVIRRRKKSWEYYFQNLSTIPDNKTYQVIDIISNQQVGTLDEEFVSLHGSPGTAFIVKGQAWRILEVRREGFMDRIYAEPLKGIMAAIPAWEGELIPVPFEVAQKVGAIRKDIEGLLPNGRKAALEHLIKKYPIGRSVAERMHETVSRQAGSGFVPGDKEIVIEGGRNKEENWAVIHTCMGSLINETVGRMVSIELTNRFGETGLQTDPYRIMLRLPMIVETKDVLQALKSIPAEAMESALKLFLVRTDLFLYRFIHVAKRFGIISRDADFGKGYVKKVMESYANTPVFAEAMNEIFTEKLDVKGSIGLIERIRKGEIPLRTEAGLSTLGRMGIEKKYELVAGERPEMEIFSIFKKRLLATGVKLICTHCGDSIDYILGDVPEDIACKRCGSRMVGVLRPFQDEYAKALKHFIKTKAMERGSRKVIDSIMDTASLVVSSGRNAVLALAGRGVGPKTAGRILAKNLEGDELLKEILEAERRFARNSRFWRD